ncbi:MAG TPA: alpha-L-arabinofuranosidase C-terminal domain-containing protein, partial [Propionibacteriaceae bacterium]
ASTKNGQALISMTNLEADAAQTVELDLRGLEFEVQSARVLNAPRVQEHNTAARPDAVAPQPFDGLSRQGRRLTVELPAHAFVTLQLGLGGEVG